MKYPYLTIKLLGFVPQSTQQERLAIRAGFKFTVIADLAQAYGVSSAIIAEVLSIPEESISHQKETGLLLPAESDRAYRLARLFDRVCAMMDGDELATREWLCTPKEIFDDESPLAHFDTCVGAQDVEELIFRLRHGVFL